MQNSNLSKLDTKTCSGNSRDTYNDIHACLMDLKNPDLFSKIYSKLNAENPSQTNSYQDNFKPTNNINILLSKQLNPTNKTKAKTFDHSKTLQFQNPQISSSDNELQNGKSELRSILVEMNKMQTYNPSKQTQIKLNKPEEQKQTGEYTKKENPQYQQYLKQKAEAKAAAEKAAKEAAAAKAAGAATPPPQGDKTTAPKGQAKELKPIPWPDDKTFIKIDTSFLATSTSQENLATGSTTAGSTTSGCTTSGYTTQAKQAAIKYDDWIYDTSDAQSTTRKFAQVSETKTSGFGNTKQSFGFGAKAQTQQTTGQAPASTGSAFGTKSAFGSKAFGSK